MTRFVSTFISHSWHQNDIASELAQQLARRGMLAWHDDDELSPGINLTTELRKAAAAQLTMTALLSADSLKSDWCRSELASRLAENEDDDAIIPIYLGDHMSLVSSSELLRKRWLTPDGKHVHKLGITLSDPGNIDYASVARDLLRAHVRRLNIQKSPGLVIVIDQRGRGFRTGRPELPAHFDTQDWPALVFRPDTKERREGEVLHGQHWTAFRDTVVEALGDATGVRCRRDVLITGNAQLSLAWLLGSFFDRSSQVQLTVYNPSRGGQTLQLDTNLDPFQSPLPRADPFSVRWRGSPPDAKATDVSVYLGALDYEQSVQRARALAQDSTPLAVYDKKTIDSLEDVIDAARWMTTACRHRNVRIYTSLPFHAIIPLAALLKHVPHHVTFMEWDAVGKEYHPCPMTTGGTQ